MAVIDQVRSEINASLNTLTRRHASSADPAEKAAIEQAISDLTDQLTLLNQAALLQTANSLASATTILESAVAAARLGPFDGYLAALEKHLERFNVLSGKAHEIDSLASTFTVMPAGKRKRKGKAKKAKKTRRAPKRKPAAVEAPAEEISFGLEPAPITVIRSKVFADLKQEYQDLFDRCQVRPECAGNVAYYVKRLRQGEPSYRLVQQQVGVPWPFVGIVHGMECGFNFTCHLHNGDKLSARTVQVPAGRPKEGQPPFTWLESAVDALRYEGLDKVTDWSLPHILYLLEGYNGFGYRKFGLPTPYLWSFSNIYLKGKFVADGHFDPEAVSKQCGAALMLKAVWQNP